MDMFGSSDIASFPTLTLMLATILVVCSTICWVCMTSHESKLHQKKGFSRLYSSLLKVTSVIFHLSSVLFELFPSDVKIVYKLQSEGDLSDNYDQQPLAELILMFRSIQMLEEDEASENQDPNNRSTWSLLKIISKKMKKDPDSTEVAARFNLHILTLKYIEKTLPTADHYVRILFSS
jgi:hypothetical protein